MTPEGEIKQCFSLFCGVQGNGNLLRTGSMGTNPLKQGKGLSLIIQHASENAVTTSSQLKARSRLYFADQDFFSPP